jgi:L-threonylcarbamoyladenylate synthase
MEEIEKAIEILNNGGIIIFPTDTAFGIGCRIDREDTIQRLFKLRRRPESQATPVLVSSIEMAQEYLDSMPEDVRDLIKKHWPGALTVVFGCKTDKVPSLVRGGGNTLGVRMPNHDKILKVIEKVGVPILGPSANFHGEKTPYKSNDLDPELIKLVEFVLPGETTIKEQSTVVDCSTKPWKILRLGAVKLNL